MVATEEWKRAVKKYEENISYTRFLSSTRVEENQTEGQYYKALKENYGKIREIARENQQLLDQIIFPGIEDEQKLDSEMVLAIQEFIDHMINGFDLMYLDNTIVIRAAERLLEDAKAKEDIAYIIKQMDCLLVVYYSLFYIANRDPATESLRDVYAEKGKKIADEMLEYLDKEKFAALTDMESRELVLINSRYATVFYECKRYDEKKNKDELEFLIHAREISNDPFYVELTPEYDWKYHHIRTCEYACTMTEAGNARGLTKEQCEIICTYADELEALVPEAVEGVICYEQMQLLCSRSRYYAGKISKQEYGAILWNIYNGRNEDSYEIDDVYKNMLVPLEFAILESKGEVTEKARYRIREVYRSMLRYMARMQNQASLSVSLEYFSEMLNTFVEIPGEMDFYELCMTGMAALHLPTYVHSNMVGKLSLCLAGHLMKESPEQFIGVLDCMTQEEVLERQHDILEYVYRAGVCHDAGKLFMIDIVFIYGRRLLDVEFALLRKHPEAGASLLGKYRSTNRYVNMALAHHKRVDGFRGDYPEALDVSVLPDRTVAEIIACADCMDAATDVVGRSYGAGITLEQYISEIRQQRGSRYAECVVRLFDNEAVREDMEFLLEHERQNLYYKSYDILFKNFRPKKDEDEE